MKPKIAIIYTTFLREELARETLKSITDNWRDDFVLLIADQGDSSKKPFYFEKLYPGKAIGYNKLPFDCGVSLARNMLVQEAMDRGIKYCILTADSIEFTPETVKKLNLAIDFLESIYKVGILGFDLNNRIPWEYDMELGKEDFILTKNTITYKDETTGLSVKKCDICRQFFIAKTEALQQVRWDNDLKTADHEDFFWRFKQAGYGVFWTPDISGNYIDCKPPEYAIYRKRMYKEFRKILQKKYNITGWVIYKKHEDVIAERFRKENMKRNKEVE